MARQLSNLLAFAVCFSLAFISENSFAVKKITFIGASITYGATLPNREQNAYPAQLQKLLGSDYVVSNFGVNGTTLLFQGNHPYVNTPEYQQALQSSPDIVFIDLGGNDSKLVNRHYQRFVSDYKMLIKSFTQLPSKPQIILLLPMVSFVKDTVEIWDPVIVKDIIPKIRQVAFEEKLEVLDMHSLLIDRPDLVPDLIHPNVEGSAIIARRLSDHLSLKRDQTFDLISTLPEEKKLSSFYGYLCADFKLNGRECKVVQPKVAAQDRPWIWRARFWGHEPQTDIALLERGFHLVYCDVAELFGNQEAISNWNNFYKLLNKAGLADKVVLEGMSRGAVYALNWAAVNPDKVAAVYIDNPVLDLKSWPGGLGLGAQSPQEREQFKADFNLKTEDDIKRFKGSPVDQVAKIVKGNYPILIICADADEAVPPRENTILFEQRMKALKGKIQVIHKPGFKHHPHSLPNPTPIVEFILAALNK